MDEYKAIASFKSHDRVFLACDDKGVLTWNSDKAAVRWFKRFYTSMAKGAPRMARKHYHEIDFRVHNIKPEVFASDHFESAVVKPEADAGKVYKADEYSVLPIPEAKFYGIECAGNLAESWHKSGSKPAYPHKG